MNITETKHKDMVFTLAKEGDEILASLAPFKCNLLHMIVGIMDEYFELQIAIKKADNENILEELGDMLFYTEGLLMDLQEYDGKLDFISKEHDETFQELARIGKRHVFYNQELDHYALYNVYENLKNWIYVYAEGIGNTLDDVRQHNMDKLAKRFPNYEYTDTRAKERADKAPGEDDTVKASDDDFNEPLGTPQADCTGEACESCQ